MAIIHALIAALARYAGKVLNTVFGWATALLFGRVTDTKQIAMSVATFGSLLWLICLIGTAIPKVAALLLAAVIPENMHQYDQYIRPGMVLGVLAIPFVVGASKMLADGKPSETGKKDNPFVSLLQGWPYTIGLAITLILMMVFAPLMKVKTLIRKWRSEHVPVMVPSADYLKAVASIEAVLEAENLPVQRKKADWMLRFPTQILTFFASKQVKDLVADQLTVLVNPQFQVQLHPSDLIITGTKQDASRIRALLAERLLFSEMFMTWEEEANDIEKEMKRIWTASRQASVHANPSRLLEELKHVQKRLHDTELDYEQWEVLFREKLQLERHLMRQVLGDDQRRAA